MCVCAPLWCVVRLCIRGNAPAVAGIRCDSSICQYFQLIGYGIRNLILLLLAWNLKHPHCATTNKRIVSLGRWKRGKTFIFHQIYIYECCWDKIWRFQGSNKVHSREFSYDKIECLVHILTIAFFCIILAKHIFWNGKDKGLLLSSGAKIHIVSAKILSIDNELKG